ncbi:MULTISPECIES: hypothetical protein [Olivibacter]|uniref:Uncharacterized protein n=1 Tax=Olivibacter oleidegradans TaxID=760123 RepID=A0ABV6HIJ6_9SPHI|nr:MULTISPECIES: hypothetical protein [Olivibacter]MDM8175942.1 hypothetical protein [Olivibacter sp. 47]
MLTTTDLGRVYETLLCIPGMNENVKIDLRISRTMVLLLTQVIQRGISLQGGEKPQGLLDTISQEAIKQLEELSMDCLSKAGLTELDERLQKLQLK